MKNFITSNKKLLCILAGVVLVIGAAIAAIVIFSKSDSAPEKESMISESTTGTETESPNNQKETADQKDKKVYYSMLTGKKSSKAVSKARPIAIMFNNIIDAIPQSGIGSASIVYEAYVEGHITRLMGVFDDYQAIDSIGSVRSCREYYAHWASEYNAVYCHFGQSGYALDFLTSGKLDVINPNDMVGNSAYYRTQDRVSPHNVFSNSEMLLSAIKQKGYSTTVDQNYEPHFKFAAPQSSVKMDNAISAQKVSVGYTSNTPYFEYNKKEKQYYRFQYGGTHIDGATGKQLSYTNIIIQYADFTLYGDGKTLNMNHIGSGTGYYISNGKAIEITWSKNSETEKTVYRIKNGNELVMNAGKTWICVFPPSEQENVHID